MRGKVGFNRARVSEMGVGGEELGFGKRVGFKWCMTWERGKWRRGMAVDIGKRGRGRGRMKSMPSKKG